MCSVTEAFHLLSTAHTIGRYLLTAGLALLGTFVSASVISSAASFDCKKAKTYVEKRICADEYPVSMGLSKLDDDLDRAYSELLQRVDNSVSLKAAQRQWLKMRDTCADAGCIERAYQERFITLHAPRKRPLTIIPSDGSTIESHLFPDEVSKLRLMQEMLRSHKFSLSVPKESFYCTQFIQHLLASEVDAVEPDARSETAYDPALKKWHRCDGKELKDSDVKDANDFFDHITTRGGPPYRSYHIDVDADLANGKEDVLYHESGPGYRYTGYTRVDLDACTIKDGAGGGGVAWLGPLRKNNPRNFYFFNLIAKHRNEYLVLEFYPATSEPKASSYRLQMWRLNAQFPRICVWSGSIIE